MTQIASELEIRPALPSDLNFIFDTFRESVRQDTSLGKSCRTSVFKREFAKVIDYVLSKAKVLIACLKSDPNVILGYLIWEPGIIHYCFVKQAFRRLGIAQMLFLKVFKAGEPIQASFKTGSMKGFFDTHENVIHNPFNLFLKGVIK